MSDLWLMALVLIGVGGLAGFTAGLFGIGGGAVMVPALFFAFGVLGVDNDVRMHSAVATSVAVIIVNGWRSVRSHSARKSVELDLLWPTLWWRSYAVWIALGSFLAATFLAPRLSSAVMTNLFAAVALVVALQFVIGRPDFTLRPDVPAGAGPPVIGGSIGALSAIMGIGGGSLSVPFLTLCSMPVHRAVGTAAGFGVAIAIPATLGFVISGWGAAGRLLGSVGYVNAIGFGLIVLSAWPAVPWGTRAAHGLSPKPLRRIFGIALALIALNMMRVAASL